MNALVVGYGSIGARHARILSTIGCNTCVVTSRKVDFPVIYHGLSDALAKHHPEYVVIANATNVHYNTFSKLGQLGYSGNVLVEKPLFPHAVPVPTNDFRSNLVAYNLRFHPVIRRLKELLQGEQILSVQAYAGQYLPNWRPKGDYRTSYSASNELGGGVLRDLSHELDYLTWILGGWSRVSAIGGKFSNLDISSDDLFALMMVTPLCPVVTLQLNYLDRVSRRLIIVNTTNRTIEADLVNATISVDNDRETFNVDRDYTYRAMHESFLSGNLISFCTLTEGMEIVRLIEAAERASAGKRWIER